MRYLCQDETRLGLKTITGRLITAKGIKPLGRDATLSELGERLYQKTEGLMRLKQKLSPNVAQTGFIGSKQVTIEGQPIKKSIRYSCSKASVKVFKDLFTHLRLKPPVK